MQRLAGVNDSDLCSSCTIALLCVLYCSGGGKGVRYIVQVMMRFCTETKLNITDMSTVTTSDLLRLIYGLVEELLFTFTKFI